MTGRGARKLPNTRGIGLASFQQRDPPKTLLDFSSPCEHAEAEQAVRDAQVG